MRKLFFRYTSEIRNPVRTGQKTKPLRTNTKVGPRFIWRGCSAGHPCILNHPVCNLQLGKGCSMLFTEDRVI